MSQELFIGGIIFLLVGLGVSLVDIAQEMSDATIDTSRSSAQALDCAFRGESVSVCSPDLLVDTQSSIDLEEQLQQLGDALDDGSTLISLAEKEGLFFHVRGKEEALLYYLQLDSIGELSANFKLKRVEVGDGSNESTYELFTIATGEKKELFFSKEDIPDAVFEVKEITDKVVLQMATKDIELIRMASSPGLFLLLAGLIAIYIARKQRQ